MNRFGQFLSAVALLAPSGWSRSVLRAGLFDVQLESGRQSRVQPNWHQVDGYSSDPNSVSPWHWETDEAWTPGRTWVLGAGVFLNDNVRVGLRWGTVTAHGVSPNPFDSSVVSFETTVFSHPEGPVSLSGSLRVGQALGFPRQDPPDNIQLYRLDVPSRVYAGAVGIRYFPTESLALDADLFTAELWAGSLRDVWHFSWLTPRISVLF